VASNSGVCSPSGGSVMKIGDLVIHSMNDTKGIVLELFPGKTLYVNVYWFSIKGHGACPAGDLEVISESR
jgi:hypothetical protein